MNREQVKKYIKDYYAIEGERLWASFPNYLVFRNPRNKKWFGIIGDVERSKLKLEGTGKVDVLVIKSDPLLIGSLIKNEGFLPAYHMNKESWVSVLLDGSAKAEDVKPLIGLAYDIIDKKK